MWIHANAGDDGLRAFLLRACDMAGALVVDPQLSRCYRKMNVRLRKRKRKEIPIDGLELRADVENQIEHIIVGCGFHRVDKPGTTEWGRVLRLYRRGARTPP